MFANKIMSPDEAIKFGQLIQAAYSVARSTNCALSGNSNLEAKYDPYNIGFSIVSIILGNDLANSFNGPFFQTVPFGLILRNAQNDYIVAIRGTQSIWEWLHNAVFLQQKCPFLDSAVYTERGFTEIYQSLYVESSGHSLANTIKAWRKPITTLTICGHSLGAAMATMLALDLCANTDLRNKISVYLYGSPRTGDKNFVEAYNQFVPRTYRIANRLDIVTKLPLAPLYEHVSELVELNSAFCEPSSRLILQSSLPCQHFLNSYLYLLSSMPGASLTQALEPQCQSPPGFELWFPDLF